jgi:cytochrome-b5 reductase
MLSRSLAQARVPIQRVLETGTKNDTFGFGAVGVFAAGFTLLSSSASCDATPPTSLSPKEFRSFKVSHAEKLSADSALFRVELPSPEHTLGMTVASCLSISAEIGGETVGRPYTPISTRTQTGHAEFVVKKYPPRTDGKAGGMGNHLFNLKVGDTIDMKGPWKKLPYEANKYKKIGMVAGGTGLTPCLQVALEILNNPDDKTKVTLLYGECLFLLRPNTSINTFVLLQATGAKTISFYAIASTSSATSTRSSA